jgi:hypothetical protein
MLPGNHKKASNLALEVGTYFSRTNLAPDMSIGIIEPEFSRTDTRSPHLQFIVMLAFALIAQTASNDPPVAETSAGRMENVMKGRVMMILATTLLAGSFVATSAQARGGAGGGGHGGGSGGGHIGGFGGAHIAGLGGGRVGGFEAGQMARAGHDHGGVGRHRFVGGDFYDGGLDCPYQSLNTRPYTCPY